MSNVSWNENVITIDGEEISFDQNILEAIETQNVIVVVTAPINGINDNVFGISLSSDEIWTIQSYSKLNPSFSQTPYVGISILDENVIVTDFCGCKFVIDPITGNIIGRANSGK